MHIYIDMCMIKIKFRENVSHRDNIDESISNISKRIFINKKQLYDPNNSDISDNNNGNNNNDQLSSIFGQEKISTYTESLDQNISSIYISDKKLNFPRIRRNIINYKTRFDNNEQIQRYRYRHNIDKVYARHCGNNNGSKKKFGFGLFIGKECCKNVGKKNKTYL